MQKKEAINFKNLLITIVLVVALLLSAVCFSGCIDGLRSIIDKGNKIARIIVTDDISKYVSQSDTEANWSDITDSSDSQPDYIKVYPNGDAYDVYYIESQTLGLGIQRLLSYNQIIPESYQEVLAQRMMLLNNRNLFSASNNLYLANGTTTYLWKCNSSSCDNYDKVVTTTTTSSTDEKCPICNNPLTKKDSDGIFTPKGTYMNIHKNNMSGPASVLAGGGKAPLEFDELIVDGFDFSVYDYSIISQALGGYPQYESLHDVNDFSYMFEGLPCKKITIKNVKGLQGNKWDSRDEYLEDRINNYLIKKVEDFKSLDNGMYYTVDDFVDAINQQVSDESDKITKEMLILECNIYGYVDCPLSYSEILRAMLGLPEYDEQGNPVDVLQIFTDEINQDPYEMGLLPKEDGSPYTKDDTIYAFRRMYNAMPIPVLSDEQMETYYNTKTRYVNLSHMFENCTNLETVDFGNMFDGVTPNNLSYMFAGCTNLKNIDLSGINTKYVTDMSNMFATTAKQQNRSDSGFASRDEYLLDIINNHFIYFYSSLGTNLGDGPFESIKDFDDAVNKANEGSSDMFTFPPKQLLLLGLMIGFVDCPVTYNDYTMLDKNLTYEEYVAKAIDDPTSVGMPSKSSGTYTKGEINLYIKNEIQGILGNILILSEEELAEYYSPTKQAEVAVSKMGKLILGGENSTFTIGADTKTDNIFGESNIFSSIILPTVDDGVKIKLPYVYSQRKVAQTPDGISISYDGILEVTSESSGRVVSVMDPLITPSEIIPTDPSKNSSSEINTTTLLLTAGIGAGASAIVFAVVWLIASKTNKNKGEKTKKFIKIYHRW